MKDPNQVIVDKLMSESEIHVASSKEERFTIVLNDRRVTVSGFIYYFMQGGNLLAFNKGVFYALDVSDEKAKWHKVYSRFLWKHERDDELASKGSGCLQKIIILVFAANGLYFGAKLIGESFDVMPGALVGLVKIAFGIMFMLATIGLVVWVAKKNNS